MSSFEQVHLYYFSASGTTKTVVEKISDSFAGKKITHDLLHSPLDSEVVCDENTLVIVGVPVFMGRVPLNCTQMLAKLKGKKTPVIAVVVYGNRDYDDSLLELTDILRTNGFHVVGAGAFAAQHSLFSQVAQGRPDTKDMQMIQEFAKKCAKKLDTPYISSDTLKVKGNTPYVKAAAIPFVPKGSKACTKCGICVSLCPMKAISADEPRKTDKNLCIACTACVAACPQKARTFDGPIYALAVKMFTGKCKERKEAEYFV